MAKVRMRNPVGDFDPTTADYTPPNGNTGVSGYGPGGIDVPPLDQPYPVPGTGDDHGGTDQPPTTLPEGGGTKPPIWTSRPRGGQGSVDRPRTQGTGGGYLPSAEVDRPTTANQEFNGDYLGYIRSLLPGTIADRNAVDDIEDELAKVGITNQRASDGTSRGRVHLPNGQYVDLVHGSGWGDTWADLQARDPYVERGGGGGGGGGGATPATAFSNPQLMEQLQALFSNQGNFNSDIVNRRTENAAATLRRSANSRKANNEAYLAERGLIGDGPQGSMVGRVDEDIANQYADAVSGIYADESEAADARMMQALSLATGMSTADADRALGYFRANNDFTLGQGNLALQNSIASNNYNLGLGNFGLDRDRLMHDIESGNIDHMIELLRLYLGGAEIGAGGHI